jgi:hypothetical protein
MVLRKPSFCSRFQQAARKAHFWVAILQVATISMNLCSLYNGSGNDRIFGLFCYEQSKHFCARSITAAAMTVFLDCSDMNNQSIFVLAL